jgi:hypothetical protein
MQIFPYFICGKFPYLFFLTSSEFMFALSELRLIIGHPLNLNMTCHRF